MTGVNAQLLCRWIEIEKIDTRIRELAPIAQPLQIVAEIESIHRTTINQNARSATKSLLLVRARAKEKFITRQSQVQPAQAKVRPGSPDGESARGVLPYRANFDLSHIGGAECLKQNHVHAGAGRRSRQNFALCRPRVRC